MTAKKQPARKPAPKAKKEKPLVNPPKPRPKKPGKPSKARGGKKPPTVTSVSPAIIVGPSESLTKPIQITSSTLPSLRDDAGVKPVEPVSKPATVPLSNGFGGLIAKQFSKSEPVNGKPPGHIVVRALAGTGKTFTEIVGVAYAFGQGIWPALVGKLGFEPIPSDEQRAVWEAMALSRGTVRTVTYCAFNKSIVVEFSEKWGWLVRLLQTVGVSLQFATVNSLGHGVVTGAYGRLNVTDWHTENLLAAHLGVDPRELKRCDPTLISAVAEITGLCKLNLTGWTEEGGFAPGNVTPEAIDAIIQHHEIELNGNRSKVYDLVPALLEKSFEPQGEIDFNDQNWLPIVRDLPIPKVDMLLVDEGQDLPRCKQEFARKLGRRVLLVGDVNQAIYGFAGADVDSIPRMERLLGNGDGPVSPLTLTETRRCGKAIVEEACKIVPGFRAHSSNPEGTVRTQRLEKYAEEVNDRDMVLCRVNAPLISQALRFIKAGRKALVRGRDFGKSLIQFVTKLKADDPADLITKADNWLAEETRKEHVKRNPSEARLMGLQDRYDCVVAFTEEAITVQDVLNKLDAVFAGKQCPRCKKHFNETSESCFQCRVPLIKPEGVLFSSVHRAKGLEANRVFILRLKGADMPHPMARSAWQRQQEMNCLYIAITRAIHELVYVTDR